MAMPCWANTIGCGIASAFCSTSWRPRSKQVLREKRLREGQGFQLDETMLANLLLAYTEGRISQFVRSEFKIKPTAGFEDQWQFIRSQLLQS